MSARRALLAAFWTSVAGVPASDSMCQSIDLARLTRTVPAGGNRLLLEFLSGVEAAPAR